MKNTTVNELIEILKTMNPNAVVCSCELDEHGLPIYQTFEICREFPKSTYINDSGEDDYGDVVAIY